MGYVPFGLHLDEESLLKAVYVMKTSCCPAIVYNTRYMKRLKLTNHRTRGDSAKKVFGLIYYWSACNLRSRDRFVTHA